MLDTNILLLLLVGCFDRELIGRFKRTNNYTSEDFDLLRGFLARFRRVSLTPHVLAEVSNLSRQMSDPYLGRYIQVFARILGGLHEHHVPKDRILPNPLLARLGVTDLSIMEIARERKYLVLTDDLTLANHLEEEQCAVVNFNWIRGQQWLRGSL